MTTQANATSAMAQPAGPQQVETWLKVLVAPGQIVELRALEVTSDGRYPHVEAGFFEYDQLHLIRGT